jgi:hypothetical protein
MKGANQDRTEAVIAFLADRHRHSVRSGRVDTWLSDRGVTVYGQAGRIIELSIFDDDFGAGHLYIALDRLSEAQRRALGEWRLEVGMNDGADNLYVVGLPVDLFDGPHAAANRDRLFEILHAG